MINEHEKENKFFTLLKKNPLKSQLFANSWQTNTFFFVNHWSQSENRTLQTAAALILYLP